MRASGRRHVRPPLWLTKAASAAGVLLAATLAAQSAPSGDQGAANVDNGLLADEVSGDNWASYGRTFSENHFSPLAQIDQASVGRLGLAWSFDLDVNQRADSQPLEADGVLYVAAGLSVVQAVDVRTGKRLWRYDPGVAAVAGDKMRPSWGIRGLALWKGRAYVGTQDGRLIALDAKTGEPVWSVMTLDPKDESTITGAPRVFNGKVVIGSAGADRTMGRGVVNCYDARTGKFLWRFYTVPGDPKRGFENSAMAMAAKTWTGEWWKYGGGGTVWNGMTYDADFNRLYIGTGNGDPWNWKLRNPGGGDALFLASVVALDADTGRYIWHYQENPNEAWDYNSTMDMELATLAIDGRPRKVLLHAPKNGFFYVIDRKTGKLISAEKIGRVTWADHIDLATGRPAELPGIRYENGPVLMWPGTFGTHNWQPMSFSPVTGLVYIPAIQQADSFSSQGIDPKTWQPVKNTWNTGLTDANIPIPVAEFGSSLLAWDPVSQKAAWRVPAPGTVNGGTMATAGGLVFQGHIDGSFNAYDAASGRRLWSFPVGVSVMGAPISYSVAGAQYVTVLAGPVSGAPAAVVPDVERFGWAYRTSPRRMLTFALDGKAVLPPPAPKAEIPLAEADFPVDPALVRRGDAVYAAHCGTCHGAAAVGRGAAPDLRASRVPLDAEAFRQVVHEGALLPAGMPRFAELSAGDLEALRHYLRRRAVDSATPAASATHRQGP